MAVGTPRANGQVEQLSRVIIPALAKLSETSNKWDREIERVEFSINNNVSRSTGDTPSRLLFGVEQVGEKSDCVRLMLNSMLDTDRNLHEIRQEATANILKAQRSNEILYNKKRKEATAYNVGDYVMIKNVDTTAGTNKKLLPKFKGPYEVTKILDHDIYIVEDIEGFQVTQIPYSGVLSPDNM